MARPRRYIDLVVRQTLGDRSTGDGRRGVLGGPGTAALLCAPVSVRAVVDFAIVARFAMRCAEPRWAPSSVHALNGMYEVAIPVGVDAECTL